MSTSTVIKPGKDLTRQELATINYHRQKVFKSDDPYLPSVDNQDWSNLFILVNNESAELLLQSLDYILLTTKYQPIA